MASSSAETDHIHRGLVGTRAMGRPIFEVFGHRIERDQTGADRVDVGELIGLTNINKRHAIAEQFERFSNPEGWDRAIHEAHSLTAARPLRTQVQLAKSAQSHRLLPSVLDIGPSPRAFPARPATRSS
jgi:hypothetical protein